MADLFVKKTRSLEISFYNKSIIERDRVLQAEIL